MNDLPLFPLNIVLFPGSRVRLHIFEPRYKLMIGRCIQDDLQFGINLVHDKKMHPVGCTARVVEVSKRYSDGTFDIVVEGMQRFEIIRTERSLEDILVGDAQLVDDVDRRAEVPEIEKAVALYNRLIAIVYKGSVDVLSAGDYENIPAGLSYLMAEKAGFELEKRQELLEILSERERLNFIIAYLEEAVPALEHLDRIRSIVTNDGYLPRGES